MDLIERQAAIQPEQQHGRVFKGVVVEYPSYNIYPEYIGKPYFSIKYTENGQEFIGYGTYKPEVLSEYLKEYFMPSAEPEITDGQAIEHLQSTGWMQRHDKQMYEMGLKEKLADDSDSYDSLMPSAEPEPLTDREQRIFLAAMGREEKVCEEVERNRVLEAYEDSLMWVCREIKRKVKGVLWT